MASIDPNLMIILEDIRQEVEDMAYNKLRTVISDFSLEGPELNEKIEKHKQSIKAEAKEIVKRRLNEKDILMTEAEFWCLCGKYAQSYARTHPRKAPLIDNIISSYKEKSDIISISTLTSSNEVKSSQKLDVNDSFEPKTPSSDTMQKTDETHEAIFEETEMHEDIKSIPSATLGKKEELSIDDEQIKISLKAPSSDQELPKILEPSAGSSQKIEKAEKRDKGFLSDKESRKSLRLRDLDTKSKSSKDLDVQTKRLDYLDVKPYRTVRKSEIGTSLENVLDASILEEAYVSQPKDESSTKISSQTKEYFTSSKKYPEALEELHDHKSLYGEIDLTESLYGEIDLTESDYRAQLKDDSWITETLYKLIDVQVTKIKKEREEIFSQDAGKLQKLSAMLGIDEKMALYTGPSVAKLSIEDLKYLQRAFGNCLSLAITNIIQKRPRAPIPYLAQYIMLYKADKYFDRSNRENFNDMLTIKQDFIKKLSRLYTQKCKIAINDEDKKILGEHVPQLDYYFQYSGKITQRRGRRLRRCILDICSTLVEKSPLITLKHKILRSQMFENILKYMQVVVRNMKHELYCLKGEVVLTIFLDVITFLTKILPELCEMQEELKSSFVPQTPLQFEGSSSLSVGMRIDDALSKVSNVSSQTEKTSITQTENCKISKPRNKSKMSNVLPSFSGSITEIIRIDKPDACQMCEEVKEIINRIKEKYANMMGNLMNFVSKGFNRIIIVDMFHRYHEFILKSRTSRDEIFIGVSRMIDILLDFENEKDRPEVKKGVKSYVKNLLSHHDSKLGEFKEKEKLLAIDELESRMETIILGLQKEPQEAPCICTEDTIPETQNKTERDRFIRALNKMKRVIRTMYLRKDDLLVLQRILESFVTRAHRDRPYLSRKAKSDLLYLRPLISNIFDPKDDYSHEEAEEEKEPCVCRYIRQAAYSIINIQHKMEKKYDVFLNEEREQMELELMQMFASLVEGLTVEDIQKQNLCAGFTNFQT